MLELVTVLAVMGILAGIAVPAASAARRALAARSGAHHLALVLRAAQARAQSRDCLVDVAVHADGGYEISDARSGGIVETGELAAAVSTNYPDGSLSFSPTGSPCMFATVIPRAGSFVFGPAAGCTVVVQLGGCIRCR